MRRSNSVYRAIASWSLLVILYFPGFYINSSLAEENTATVTWQSEHRNLHELSKDISRLYIFLHKQESLRIREYVDPIGMDVQTIMRKEKLFYGPSFLLDLELLLCKLNKPVCTVRAKPFSSPSKVARWKNRKGSQLNLPNVELITYQTPQRYYINQGDKIRDIVLYKQLGCVEFDDACKSTILNLNRRDRRVLDGTFEGEIVVPTLSIRTQLSRQALQPASRFQDDRVAEEVISLQAKTKHIPSIHHPNNPTEPVLAQDSDEYVKLEGSLTALRKEPADQDKKFSIFRDYGKAQQLSASVKTDSERVKALSTQRKEEAKAAALQAQQVAEEAVKATQDLVGRAPAGKDRVAVEAIRDDVEGLKSLLKQIQVSIDKEDFPAADTMAKAIHDMSQSVSASIEGGSEGFKPLVRVHSVGQPEITNEQLMRPHGSSDTQSHDINKNLVSSIQINFNSSMGKRLTIADEPHYLSQAGLFKAIHHPFAVGQDIPQMDDNATIAIFDKEILLRHCEFEDDEQSGRIRLAFVQESKREEGIIVRPNGDCELEAQAIAERDHGTHITGIIGAHVNGKGIVGLNPYANIYAFAMHPQELLSEKDVSDLSSTIYKAARELKADVFNISWEYKPQQNNDTILSRLKNLKNSLFIVAAGNTATEMSAGCIIFPACSALPNVLSVVALNKTSTDLFKTSSDGKGSNYGTVFNIAAPGEDILGPLSTGELGKLSGTSQAAAVITSAASILLSTDIKLRPRAVKQRLIYSSDFLPALADKVLGGGINFERALDYRVDVVQLKSNQRRFRGKIRDKDFIVFMEGIPETKSKRFKEILRLECPDELCTMMVDQQTGATVRKFLHVETLERKKRPIKMLAYTDSKDPKCSESTPCLRVFGIKEIFDYTSSLPELNS